MTYSELKPIVKNLIKRSMARQKRKIVPVALNEMNMKPDIKIFRGFRGVGKTTALLQVIGSSTENCFYFSADWPQVRRKSLYDFTVDVLKEGFNYIFIDEIHTYPSWEVEIKAIVDQFPDTKIFASGSAPVVFTGDRREKIYDLSPLDFSEFLYLKYKEDISPILAGDPDEWMDEGRSIASTASFHPRIEGWFKEYYHIGGFPVCIEYSFDDTLEAIFSAIKISLEKDAVSFLKISSPKILAMEKLLYFIATSPPGEMSITSMCKNLGVSKDSIYEIISALENMKIIRQLKPHGGGSKLVRGESKLLFAHPNFRTAICKKLGIPADIGSIREELALFGLAKRGYHIFTLKGLKKSPDYMIKKGNTEMVIEIGGESKNRKQLEGFDNAILVRDSQLIRLLLI